MRKLCWLDPILFLAVVYVCWVPLSYFLEQSRLEHSAQQILDIAMEHRIGRIALPDRFRGQVTKFLTKGIVPVLVSPTKTPVAQLRLHHAQAVVVFQREERLDLFNLDTIAQGVGFRIIDLSTIHWPDFPIKQEEEISLDYARPYLYLPLADSLALNANQTQSYSFYLEAGRYVVHLLGFGSQGRLLVRALSDGNLIQEQTFKVDKNSANRLATFEFEQAEGALKEVTVELQYLPPKETGEVEKYFLHRIVLSRSTDAFSFLADRRLLK